MATSAIGTTVPAGSDTFDPQAWIVAHDLSLHSRIAVPAVNQTARLALASSCGWTPTVADPLRVYQTDTRVEYLYDGAAWYVIGRAENDSGWLAATLDHSWVNFNAAVNQGARIRKINDLLYVEGLVKDGAPGASIIDLPSTGGWWPTRTHRFLCEAAGGTVVVSVNPNGSIQTELYLGGGFNNYISLDNIKAVGLT